MNVSSIVVLLLGLNTRRGLSPAKGMPCPANLMARRNFARVLLASAQSCMASEVLGELACATMKLHAEWLAVCVKKPEATMLDFGEALGATAVAIEHLLDTLPQSGKDQCPKTVFSRLDFIKPESWLTRCQLVLYRWASAMLEATCRLIAVLAELFAGCFGKRTEREL